jgi:LemA protein
MSPLLIIIAAVALFAIFAIGIYNSLVTLRQRYKNAFAQIDVQLKRRYDLIPNLVETAKGYMKHERETLEAVVNARNQALGAAKQASGAVGNPEAMQSLNAAEGTLNSALSRMMLVVERYPELKADKNMAMLQEEITATENKVAFSRQAFNDAVTAYNTKREIFPASILAGLFGFQPATLFEVTQAAEREAPRVQF